MILFKTPDFALGCRKLIQVLGEMLDDRTSRTRSTERFEEKTHGRLNLRIPEIGTQYRIARQIAHIQPGVTVSQQRQFFADIMQNTGRTGRRRRAAG